MTTTSPLPSKGILPSLFFLLLLAALAFTSRQNTLTDNILSYTVDPKTHTIQFYWKNDKGEVLQSIGNLKSYLESKNQELLFAMNGGMYMENLSPLGLFIQNSKTMTKLNLKHGSGNFYLKPNGVFYLTNDNTPVVCQTASFTNNGNIKYATQSGPMLVFDGKINPQFVKGSKNTNIRNGVGILPNNKVVFAISKQPVNFYDFALYFQNLGCKNALYLDGFVSRMYLPAKQWIQTDGDFGVMIGVTKKKPNT